MRRAQQMAILRSRLQSRSRSQRDTQTRQDNARRQRLSRACCTLAVQDQLRLQNAEQNRTAYAALSPEQLQLQQEQNAEFTINNDHPAPSDENSVDTSTSYQEAARLRRAQRMAILRSRPQSRSRSQRQSDIQARQDNACRQRLSRAHRTHAVQDQLRLQNAEQHRTAYAALSPE